MGAAVPETEAALVEVDRNNVLHSVHVTLILTPGVHKSGLHVAVTTKYRRLAPVICGSLV